MPRDSPAASLSLQRKRSGAAIICSATWPAFRCVLLGLPDLLQYWVLRHRALGGQIWLRARPRHELLGGGPGALSRLPGLSPTGGFDLFGGLTLALDCFGRSAVS
jgi:hypothetical protein